MTVVVTGIPPTVVVRIVFAVIMLILRRPFEKFSTMGWGFVVVALADKADEGVPTGIETADVVLTGFVIEVAGVVCIDGRAAGKLESTALSRRTETVMRRFESPLAITRSNCSAVVSFTDTAVPAVAIARFVAGVVVVTTCNIITNVCFLCAITTINVTCNCCCC